MANILVLEDNAALRRILVHVLSEAGHSITQRENGLAAYEDRLIGGIDLLITDLVMPGVDGLEAIRRVRENYPDLKVIAISGGRPSFNQDYLDVARVFGASDVLKKPFEPSELIRIVNAALASAEADDRPSVAGYDTSVAPVRAAQG